MSEQKWSFYHVSRKNSFFVVSAQKWSFYHVSTKIEFLSRQHKNGVFITSAQK